MDAYYAPNEVLFGPMSEEELADWEASLSVAPSGVRPRKFDIMREMLPHIPDSAFFESMSEAELADWEDGPIFPPD